MADKLTQLFPINRQAFLSPFFPFDTLFWNAVGHDLGWFMAFRLLPCRAYFVFVLLHFQGFSVKRIAQSLWDFVQESLIASRLKLAVVSAILFSENSLMGPLYKA